MSQDSDSSASSEEYGNLMEQAEHEADASAGELAAMSSSTLKADPDGSFLGKVRTNVSNMISKLFRSPKEEANAPKHNQQNRLASIARGSNDEGLRTIEQRKRKHSSSVSPSAGGDHYAEMIRKRSRLNIATEAVTQPADTSLVNRLSRDSTPNSAQLCSSYSEIRRRPLSKSAAGRSLQMRRAATQSLSRRALADRSANRSGNRNIASGVGRISPWAVPSDSMPYGLSNKGWQPEFSNGHDSEQDCISSTPRSTNSPIEEEIDGASVTSDKQEHPEGVDNLSYAAGGDRVSEPYVPFGNQQKFEAALKAANDPSRRYTTFLGNAVARQRSRSGSTSSLNFWSHLDHDKSLFRSGNTYERPAFNPSVYGNSSFSSYFYDGVPRYGGASAVPFNQSRLNGLRTPLPPKRTATETVVTSNMISTQSQIIQTILDSCSTQNAEKRRREANDLLRQEKTLMEKTRQLLESCNQTGSGLVRLRKPTTQSGLISQRLRNATSNNELLVPRMQQMMAISLLQKTNRARDCIGSQGTLCPQENSAARQTVSDELMAEKSNRARGEVAASDRRIGNPVVPIEYKAGQHSDLAASPNRVHSSVGTASSAHGEQANPAKQLFAPNIVTMQHSASVGTPKVIAPNTPTYSNQPKASDAAVCRNGHLFVFSSPAILDPAVKGTSVIASTRYKFNGPQLLTSLVEEPTSFQQLIAATSAGNKWQCDVCLVWSEQSATKCVACESAKPQPKTTASSSGASNVDNRHPPSFQQLIAATSAGNKWQCDVCLVWSEQSATKCVACESAKPQTKTTAPSSGASNVDNRHPPSFQQLIAATSAGNKWQCDVCLVWSEQSATKCVACESAKPQPKTTAPSSGTTIVDDGRPPSFQQLIAAASAGNKWQCDVCSVWSEQSAIKCVACESAKPQPKTTAPRSGATNVDDGRPPSFQQLIAATSAGNKWQCDVCLVWSEQSATKCVACESAKPQPKTTAPRSGATNVDDGRPPSFQQLIAAASAGNKWQCDVCSVWSEQSATKCVACESAKPQPKATASSASTRKSTNIATSNSTTGTANICRPLPPIHQFFESTVDNGPSNASELFGAQQTFFGRNGPTPKQLASTVSSAVITISDESDDDEDSVCEVVTDDSPVISTDSSTIPFDTTKNGTGEFYSSGIQFQPVDQLASQNYVSGAKWPLNVSLDGSNGNNFDSDGDKYTYEHKKAVLSLPDGADDIQSTAR